MTDSDEARGVRPAWVDWTLTIAAGVLLALMVRAFVAEVYVVPSASMLETIHEGDRLVGEKVSYRLGRPSVGDVVTFNDPDGSGSTLIKRVIAIEGQTIDLRNGTLYVDGVAQSERYVDGRPSYALTQHAANLEQDISYGPEGLRLGDGGQPHQLARLALLWRGERRPGHIEGRLHLLATLRHGAALGRHLGHAGSNEEEKI